MFRSVLRNPPDFKISPIGDVEQEGHIVSVLVAKNVATTQQVFVESILVYVYDAEFWEFSFTITVIALDRGSEDFTTQNRTIARGFIPSSIRKFKRRGEMFSKAAAQGFDGLAAQAQTVLGKDPFSGQSQISMISLF